MTLLEELKAARANPNAKVFLDMTAAAEGTTKNGYLTAFGGGKLASLADHPRKLHEFTQTNGKKNKTSAAGRYQFTQDSWNDAVKALGLKDFKDESQDLAALYLLRRAGGLDAALKGDFNKAVEKAGTVWASFPSSKYPQPKKSGKFIDDTVASLMGKQGSAIPSIATTPMAPPASAGGALVSAQQAVAAPQEAMATIFEEANKPQVPSYAETVAGIQNSVPQEEEEPADSWANQLMGQAVDDDATAARNSAVSNFFGEVVVPKLQIPQPIEDSINQYLARLS